MSLVLWSNCRPGCIQFAPAAWPCLAVDWNETSHVVISTFSGLLCKVIWIAVCVSIGFVGCCTESRFLQIFRTQSRTVLCAHFCYASQNMCSCWNNSYLDCPACQKLRIKSWCRCWSSKQPSGQTASLCRSCNHWVVILQHNKSC